MHVFNTILASDGRVYTDKLSLIGHLLSLNLIHNIKLSRDSVTILQNTLSLNITFQSCTHLRPV